MIYYDNVTPPSLKFPTRQKKCFEFSVPICPYKQREVSESALWQAIISKASPQVISLVPIG